MQRKREKEKSNTNLPITDDLGKIFLRRREVQSILIKKMLAEINVNTELQDDVKPEEVILNLNESAKQF